MANLVAPVIPESYNPMDSFLKGFGIVAQLNQRRQQSELAMQKMIQDADLKQKAMEQEMVLKDRLYDVREKTLMNRATNADAQIDLRQQRLDLDRSKDEYARKQSEDEMTDVQGVLRAVQKLKAPLGTPERNIKLAEIGAMFPRASKNSLAKSVIAKEWEDHEGAVKSKAKLFNDKLKQFGLPYNAFENSQEWIERPDGKQYYYRTDHPATGQREQVPITVNNSTFRTLNKEFQDILGATAQAPSRQMEEADDKHKKEWRDAKSKMSSKGAAAVKSIYESLGYDPGELDRDVEP